MFAKLSSILFAAISIQLVEAVDEFVFDIPREPDVDQNEILKIRHFETPDFIKYYGYPSETYEVTTDDGYVLQLDRIPHGKENNSTIGKRPVVFLQHGLASYSRNWLTAGPGKALGFILADNGYDVWMGNARGTCYSRKHKSLNPDTNKKAFWDFCWHEIGSLDLPAMLDFVLDRTEEDDLFYVGHSQGTTVYFVLMSERPEYAKKIRAQFSLAPVAYLNNSKKTMADEWEPIVEVALDLFDFQELSNNEPTLKFITRTLCPLKFVDSLCVLEIFDGAGYDYPQLNVSLIPLLSYHYPAGLSFKQAKHFWQVAGSGEFQHFDYGHLKNLLLYNTTSPPKYNLTNVTPPTYLIYGNNDLESTPKDVQRLFDDLPEGNKYMYLVPYEKWNHLDFLVGINASQLIYDYVLQNMQQYLSS